MPTVTTYFVDDDQKGPLYTFIANKNCRMYVVPRSKLSYIENEPMLQNNHSALYILIGDDESKEPRAYIGETTQPRTRLKQHGKKAFWQKVLIFVSESGGLNKSDVLYLEHKAIAEAKKVNSFVLLDNKTTPQAPKLQEHQCKSMDEFFKDVKFLASFLGYNIFEKAQHKTGHTKKRPRHPNTQTQHKTEHIFYTKARGCNAKGFYNSTTRKFTVMKDSVIAKGTTASFKGKKNREDKLGKFTDALVMKSDESFDSPSAAAEFCIGRSCNGWLEWKDKDGKSLDSVYRKQLVRLNLPQLKDSKYL